MDAGEGVFYDKEAGLVLLSENDSERNPITGNVMENIGFVEKTDNEKTDMVKFLVDSAKGINTSKINKEANPMTKSTKKTEEVVEKTDAVVEEVKIAPEADAVVEAPVAEVVKAEDAIIAEVKTENVETSEITKAEEQTTAPAAETTTAQEVSKSDEVIVESVTEIKNTLTSAFSDLVATVKSLQAEVATLSKSLDSVAKEVTESKGEFDKFGKRIDAVEADTAFRKSGDLGEIIQDQPEMVEKSLWGGRFLKTADLFR